MKCIISGCEIPARAQIQSPLFTTGWWVCGVHRRPMTTLINEAQKEFTTRRDLAMEISGRIMVEGIDGLGDHEAERELEYPFSLAK